MSCPSPTELLAGVSDRQFRDAVDLDLRRRAPAGVPEALRSPELRERWLTVLTAMHRKTEGTLAGRRQEWLEYVACYGRDLGALINKHRQTRGDERRQIWHQINELKAERQTREAEYRRLKAGSIRFKTGLEEWLVEARALCDTDRCRDLEGIIRYFCATGEAMPGDTIPDLTDRQKRLLVEVVP